MTAFVKHRRSGRALATFTAFEADVLRSLARQLIELLRSESSVPGTVDPLEAMFDFTGPTAPPEDPVLQRLFPTAYTEDEEAAGEFRRYTETDLRNGKAAGAAAVIDALEQAGLEDLPEDGTFIDVELDRTQAITWMRFFTDMRLTIAVRLGIEDDDDLAGWYDAPQDDPALPVLEIYEWLAILQETLVNAVR